MQKITRKSKSLVAVRERERERERERVLYFNEIKNEIAGNSIIEKIAKIAGYVKNNRNRLIIIARLDL